MSTNVSEFRKNGFGRINILDTQISLVLKQLERQGLRSNTLIVFASDNGACFATGGSNYPFRGQKNTLFEGGVRVPAFINFPLSFNRSYSANSHFSGLFHVTDWLPTLFSFLSIPTGPYQDHLDLIDGMDLSQQVLASLNQNKGAIQADLPMRTEILVNYSPYKIIPKVGLEPADPTGAIIVWPYKYIAKASSIGWSTQQQLYESKGDGTCEHAGSGNEDFLFNLEVDPNETTNLIDDVAYTEVLKALQDRFHSYHNQTLFPPVFDLPLLERERYFQSHGAYVGPYIRTEEENK